MAGCVTTSPVTNAPGDSPAVKEYRCTWQNCTKSFSRAEHLHRHALNHDETKGNFTCQRCQAVFRRRDLLERHNARHKEKDEEAGGEGLGKLQTRKKLWRDSTGAVVAKRRPEHEKRPLSSASASKRLKVRDNSLQSMETFSNRVQKDSPTPPLVSINKNRSDAAGSPELAREPPQTDNLWLPGNEDPGLESFHFLCNASWGSQSQESSNPDILYNDIFAPDTASSFDMPFASMSYYNWLFGKEGWPLLELDSSYSLGSSSMSSFDIIPGPSSQQYSNRGQSHLDALRQSTTMGEDSMLSDLNLEIPSAATGFSRRSCSQESMSPETSAANQILALSQMAGTNIAARLGYQETSLSLPLASRVRGNISISPEYLPTPLASGSNYELDSNSDSLKRLRRLPVIDEVAHEAILSFIDHVRPKVPDGPEITREHHLLSLAVLQDYCDLYFTKFNNAYPLLHQPTFDPALVDPLLLVSVLLLGATFSNRDAHLFAICIHDVLRAQILGNASFTTRPPLWILQTILLVECFGKSRAGQRQHDMSHLFHGLLINLIRRSDCQFARCQVYEEKEVQIERRWKAEVEAEQRRRLALFYFMWDTQHAVLFSQSLCMNSAELRLTLPWDDSLWEAETAEEWHRLRPSNHAQPLYLSVLKSYINPGSGSRPRSLNALSRVLMLHGLMSVAWDLNRRDQTSPGVHQNDIPQPLELIDAGLAIAGKDEPWQARMGRSYDAWKVDFDAYSKEILLSLNESDSSKQEFQKFCAANLAIYHAAHIILHVEINDLQIYAGAAHINGRPVTKIDRERSRKRIERWFKVNSLSAAKAGSHSAHILRDGIRKLKDLDAGDFFHHPWCLYLATLTCWTFQICSRSNDGGDEGQLGEADDDDMDWDSRAEMNALVSAMARSSLEDLGKVARKYRTGDLPRVIAKHLSSIRWAVVQEGMLVLKGLIGNDRGR